MESKKPLKLTILPYDDKEDYENYSRGIYNEKPVVINTNTGVIMEYYFDDVPGDFIFIKPAILKYINKNDGKKQGKIAREKLKTILKLNPTYFDQWKYSRIDHSIQYINKQGRLSILNPTSSIGYLNYNINYQTSNGKRICVTIPYHILMAIAFIPNIDPDKLIIVNHTRKDHNNVNPQEKDWKTFEWTTIGGENGNIKKDRKTPKKESFFYKIDNSWYDEKEYKNLSPEKQKLSNNIKFTESAKKLYIKCQTLDKGFLKIFFDQWKSIEEYSFITGFVNPLGFFKTGVNNFVIKIGSARPFNTKQLRRFINNYPTAKIVFNKFCKLNGPSSKEIEIGNNYKYDDYTVDHENDDATDDGIYNLFGLSRGENMAKENKRKGILNDQKILSCDIENSTLEELKTKTGCGERKIMETCNKYGWVWKDKQKIRKNNKNSFNKIKEVTETWHINLIPVEESLLSILKQYADSLCTDQNLKGEILKYCDPLINKIINEYNYSNKESLKQEAYLAILEYLNYGFSNDPNTLKMFYNKIRCIINFKLINFIEERSSFHYRSSNDDDFLEEINESKSEFLLTIKTILSKKRT